jgi:hypothetical protein
MWFISILSTARANLLRITPEIFLSLRAGREAAAFALNDHPVPERPSEGFAQQRAELQVEP